MPWQHAAPYPDAEPLAWQLRLLLEAEYAGKVTVVNPFGAVISQNKLSLAFMWEHQKQFSPLAQRWIRRYIPETYRLTQVPVAAVQAQRTEWVLKSAYGCEGSETFCGPFVSPDVWGDVLAHALPQMWVCQRFFHVAPEPDGTLCNYGVYVIGGRSAGFLSRLSTTSTDAGAITAPTFLAKRKAL